MRPCRLLCALSCSSLLACFQPTESGGDAGEGETTGGGSGSATEASASATVTTTVGSASMTASTTAADTTAEGSASDPTGMTASEPTDSVGSSSEGSGAAAICGDGVPGGDEQCDDGNDVDTDACLNDCTVASCGDGITWAGTEDCDDNNVVNTDACKNDCTAASCGDGVVWDGMEQCDDGDQDNADACTAACQDAACGDTFVQFGEDCDDGNVVDHDGCSADCSDEPFCYQFSGQIACPSGATQWCLGAEANCENSSHALIACDVCMDGGCQLGQEVCSDSTAAGVPGDQCPADYAFVYGSAICSAGNVIYECQGGGSFGSWC